MAVEFDKKGFQEEGVVTQELASSELIAEVPLRAEIVGPLVEEEAVSLPIHNNQAETLGDKVCT